MAVIIRLQTSIDNSTYEFPANDMPLVTRRVAYQRLGDQGPAYRRMNVTLSGYFQGNNHIEVMQQLQNLQNFVRANQIKLYYHDGSQVLIDNKMCYVEDFSEPEDWKEYDGRYSISLYYFEDCQHPALDQQIAVSYASSAGTFTFNPAPVISNRLRKRRADFRSNETTFAGVQIGQQANITLTGFVKSTNYTTLKGISDQMAAAFSRDGQLTYGTFIVPVRIEDIQIPPVFPKEIFDYTISLAYDIGEAFASFSMKREFSRIHNNPQIRDRSYCNLPPYVLTLGESGQTIRYSFEAEAAVGYDITNLRSLLVNEMLLSVFTGGIELEGGREVWDDQRNTVSLSFSRFYPTPILANLGGI